MTAETRDERKVDAKLLVDPFDGRGRVVGQDLGELGDDEVTSRAGRVLVEDVDGVLLERKEMRWERRRRVMMSEGESQFSMDVGVRMRCDAMQPTHRDSKTDLCLGESTVHTRGGLGGVAAEERVLFEDDDVSTALEHGVGSRQAGETAANNDDLGRHFFFCW